MKRNDHSSTAGYLQHDDDSVILDQNLNFTTSSHAQSLSGHDSPSRKNKSKFTFQISHRRNVFNCTMQAILISFYCFFVEMKMINFNLFPTFTTNPIFILA
jgi:hypothetical protein